MIWLDLRKLGSKDREERSQARQRLVSAGADAVPGLLKALADPNELTRREALEALGEIGDHRGWDGASQRLKDSDSTIRLIAVYTITRIDEKRSVNALLDVALSDPEANVVNAAAYELLRIGDAKTFNRLIENLISDFRNPKRRMSAVKTVNHMMDRGRKFVERFGTENPTLCLLEPLCDLLGTDDYDLMLWVLFALHSVGATSSLAPVIGRVVPIVDLAQKVKVSAAAISMNMKPELAPDQLKAATQHVKDITDFTRKVVEGTITAHVKEISIADLEALVNLKHEIEIGLQISDSSMPFGIRREYTKYDYRDIVGRARAELQCRGHLPESQN